MKKLILLLLTPLLALTLVGCGPPSLERGGWAWDPSPSNPIKVQAGASFGYPMQWSLDYINRTAGTTVFAVDWTGAPDVTFSPLTPICPGGDCTQRRHMWVQRLYTGPYVYRCVIHYDPTMAWLDPYLWAADIVAHELMHCLDYPDVYPPTDYVGVMSYYRFYDAAYRASAWWGADDREMLARDGYGP